MLFDRSIPESKIRYFENRKRKTKNSVKDLIPDYWSYQIQSHMITRLNLPQSINAYSKFLWWQIKFSYHNHNGNWPYITLVFTPCAENFRNADECRFEIRGYNKSSLSRINEVADRDIPKICACAQQIIEKMDHRNF